MQYIDVILPLALNSKLTYSLPDELKGQVEVGMRVIVPLGRTKMYTAIVTKIHAQKPELYETKNIITLLDNYSILRSPQLEFWEWLASYYQSSIGEVYTAALPSALKIGSETKVAIRLDFDEEIKLTNNEQKIIDVLSDGKVHEVKELSKVVEIKSIMPILKTLMHIGMIEISEELNERYKAKTATYIRLHDKIKSDEQIKAVFDELNRAPKQLEAFMAYLELSNFLNSKKQKEVSKNDLMNKSKISNAVLNGLLDREVLVAYKKEIGRLDLSEIDTEKEHPLNSFQQEAMDSITKQFHEKDTVLLHGVTSSGKTEIYIHLIKQALEEKKQVLYLVPEIALTTQLTSRLKRIFGNKLAVFHSRFSDAERVEIWENILLDKGYEIVIGARSSLFMPFRKLGLVIVDEEHEGSYKQYNPSPRYHARNAAIVLAQMHGAKVLLGSATPSIESYYNAMSGKFGLVELTQRYQDLELPQVILSDVKEARRKKEMQGLFSPILIERMKQALSRNEQVILFQNRRGYAPFIECKACSYIPKCKNCDVSLTVHRYLKKLTCHYCGYTENEPTVCPVCNTPKLEHQGFGTEKVTEELLQLFPEVKASRMDYDTTRSKKAYETIIREFESGKVDILVGTQMVTKGLDFDRVSLVGILNADNMLNFPDFRSHERAFQLMAQVSGRAGRKNKRGTVVLQTANPAHPVIQQVVNNNYQALYQTQIAERKQFRYPPFYRLIEITLRHRDFNVLDKAIAELAITMKSYFGNRVMGPNIPMVARVQNLYIKNILLKIELSVSPQKVKDVLLVMSNELLAKVEYKAVRISLDVDPM